MIVTARMRLVPATVALARAELTDRAEFARLLSAVVPDEWPPEILADARSGEGFATGRAGPQLARRQPVGEEPVRCLKALEK